MIARSWRVLILAGEIIGLLLLVSPASAKGPLEAEIVISGGDLAHEIRIPAAAVDRLQEGTDVFVGSYTASAPPTSVPSLYYRLDFYAPDEHRLMFSLDFFPGSDGRAAMVREVECTHSPRCWLGNIDPEFNAFLQAYLEGRSPALPPLPGPPVAGPLAALALLLGVTWLVRRPPIRKRLARLAY